jgi:hypothetical protein
MRYGKRIYRRQFMQDSMAFLGAGSVAAKGDLVGLATPANPNARGGAAQWRVQSASSPAQTLWILIPPEAGFQEQLASRELARGLRNLGIGGELIQVVISGAQPRAADSVFTLMVKSEGFRHPEAYEIARESDERKPFRVRLTGATPQAVLYAVFEFLER